MLLACAQLPVGGCRKPSPPPPRPFTIAFAPSHAPDGSPALQKALADWNAAHAATPAVVEILPAELGAPTPAARAALLHGDGAAAALVPNEWLGPLTADEALRPLPDALAARIRLDCLPALADSVGARGKIVAAPYEADPWLLWLRRDSAAAKGVVPDGRRWNLTRFEILAHAGGIGRRGFAFPTHGREAAAAFLPWYFSRGGALVDATGLLTFDIDAADGALSQLVLARDRPTRAKAAPSDADEAPDCLVDGRCAMALATWARRAAIRQAGPLAAEVAALPIPGPGAQPGVTLIEGWSFVVFRGAAPAAFDLLAALWSAALQRDKLHESGSAPVFRELLGDSWFATDPDGPALRLALTNGVGLPLHPALPAALAVITEMVAAVCRDKAPPWQAAGQAAARIAAAGAGRPAARAP